MALFGKKDDVRPQTLKEQFTNIPITSDIKPEVTTTPEPRKDSTPHIYAKIPLLLIREPVDEDTEQLYQLGLSIPELTSKEEDPWASKAEIKRRISYNHSDCLVAELEGKIVGFVITEKEGYEHVCIVFVGIHPDYRKSGIGRYLITQIESKSNLAEDFYLFATSDNAVKYFEGFGYEQGKTMTYMRKIVKKK